LWGIINLMFKGKHGKIWTVVGVLLLVVVVYLLSRHTHLIQRILYGSGPWTLLVAFILYPLLAPTPITTDPITPILAVVYGPVIAVLISFIGNMLGSTVEYFVGERIGRATNFEKTKEKIPFGLGKLQVNSVPFLIFGRMVPGYGGKVISLIAGTNRVPLKRFWWTTAVTNFAGSVLLAYGGWGLVKAIKISRILHYLRI